MSDSTESALLEGMERYVLEIRELHAENERLRASLAERDGIWHQAIAERDASVASVERLRVALAESERVSGERLGRIGELRDALIRVEADSRKLGIAPGQLGDTAGRALAGHKGEPSALNQAIKRLPKVDTSAGISPRRLDRSKNHST